MIDVDLHHAQGIDRLVVFPFGTASGTGFDGGMGVSVTSVMTRRKSATLLAIGFAAAIAVVGYFVVGSIEPVPQGSRVDIALFTVEGFDYDKVVELVETSSLTDAQKAGSRMALDVTRDSPDVLELVLQNLRSDLGY